MRVQWLYAIEALFGLIGALAALLLARRFKRRPNPVGFRGWMANFGMVVLSLIGFGGLAFLVLGPHRAFAPGIAQNGRSLAAFRFQSVADGSWHSLGEYRGKVVLLNIWVTQRELGPRGVVVLMVSDQEPKLIREYLAQHPVKTEQGYVSDAPEAAQSRHLTGIGATPLTFIVDRDGVAREFLVGAGNSKRFSELIRRYL